MSAQYFCIALCIGLAYFRLTSLGERQGNALRTDCMAATSDARLASKGTSLEITGSGSINRCFPRPDSLVQYDVWLE